MGPGRLMPAPIPADGDGPLDGPQDSRVRAAAAEMPIQSRAHRRPIRVRLRIQQRLQPHDDPGAAVAALHRVQLDEGPLQRVQLAVLMSPALLWFPA